MNKLLFGMVASSAMLFAMAASAQDTVTQSVPAASNKIVVKVPAQPVAVKLQDNNYVLVDPSATVTSTTDTYYFTVDGKRAVCFPQQRTDVVGLQPLNFGFSVGGANQLYCTYDVGQFNIVTTP